MPGFERDAVYEMEYNLKILPHPIEFTYVNLTTM